MDNDTVIKVDRLYKKFSRSLKRSMLYGTTDVTKNLFGIKSVKEDLRKSEFWALENISFELKKGEALGLIGQNGSGKSTLLRLINGIFPPDRGEISVRGRIGALIAVGAGFHPHMTGRENIYLNGAILGMSREEIDSKFQDIVDFADIGDFMDAPVATYSSGMNVRLGFAIAIHSDADILLADEVLAVGDLSFVLKCYRKIGEYREKGGSLILVSHGMQLVRNTCEKALWIDHGKVVEYGTAQDVCDHYEQYMVKKDAESQSKEGMTGSIINNDEAVHITNVKFLDKNSKETSEFKVGDKLTARITFETDRVVEKPIFTISIFNPENIVVISNYTNFDGVKIDQIEDEGYIDFELDNIQLKPSQYKFSVTLSERGDVNNHLEWHEKMYTFNIVSNGVTSYGLYNPNPKWDLVQGKENYNIKSYLSDTPEYIEVVKKYITSEKPVLMDIGSCEGEDSIRFSKLYPQAEIYAFEPLPSNIEKIKHNIAQFERKNIYPQEVALSSSNGTAKFYVSSGHPDNQPNTKSWDFGNKSSSLLEPNVEEIQKQTEWLKFNKVIDVKTQTLDSFCKDKKIKEIDFIHMDVQGAELEVLKGAEKILPNIKAIYLEVSVTELYKDQPLKESVENYLTSQGFSKVLEKMVGVSGDELYINNNL